MFLLSIMGFSAMLYIVVLSEFFLDQYCTVGKKIQDGCYLLKVDQ